MKEHCSVREEVEAAGSGPNCQEGGPQFPGSREWKHLWEELFVVGFLSFGSGGLCPEQ